MGSTSGNGSSRTDASTGAEVGPQADVMLHLGETCAWHGPPRDPTDDPIIRRHLFCATLALVAVGILLGAFGLAALPAVVHQRMRKSLLARGATGLQLLPPTARPDALLFHDVRMSGPWRIEIETLVLRHDEWQTCLGPVEEVIVRGAVIEPTLRDGRVDWSVLAMMLGRSNGEDFLLQPRWIRVEQSRLRLQIAGRMVEIPFEAEMENPLRLPLEERPVRPDVDWPYLRIGLLAELPAGSIGSPGDLRHGAMSLGFVGTYSRHPDAEAAPKPKLPLIAGRLLIGQPACDPELARALDRSAPRTRDQAGDPEAAPSPSPGGALPRYGARWRSITAQIPIATGRVDTVLADGAIHYADARLGVQTLGPLKGTWRVARDGGGLTLTQALAFTLAGFHYGASDRGDSDRGEADRGEAPAPRLQGAPTHAVAHLTTRIPAAGAMRTAGDLLLENRGVSVGPFRLAGIDARVPFSVPDPRAPTAGAPPSAESEAEAEEDGAAWEQRFGRYRIATVHYQGQSLGPFDGGVATRGAYAHFAVNLPLRPRGVLPLDATLYPYGFVPYVRLDFPGQPVTLRRDPRPGLLLLDRPDTHFSGVLHPSGWVQMEARYPSADASLVVEGGELSCPALDLWIGGIDGGLTLRVEDGETRDYRPELGFREARIGGLRAVGGRLEPRPAPGVALRLLEPSGRVLEVARADATLVEYQWPPAWRSDGAQSAPPEPGAPTAATQPARPARSNTATPPSSSGGPGGLGSSAASEPIPARPSVDPDAPSPTPDSAYNTKSSLYARPSDPVAEPTPTSAASTTGSAPRKPAALPPPAPTR